MNEIIEYAEQLNKILKSMHFDLIFEAVINIIIILILFKMVNIFEKKTKENILEKHKTSQLIKFIPILTRILKFIIVFLAIAAFLQSNGYSVSSLIAGFGITGLAVGFAANATIANIFGTLAILSDRAYDIGDYIKVGDVEGTVEDINLRSTKIRTLDNFVCTLPNNSVSGANIFNISKAHKRRINEVFGITYDTSNEKIQRACEILTEIAEKHSDIYNDFLVAVDTLADSSINIKFIAYVKTNNYTKYMKVKEQIIFEAVKRFRAEGIDFAFPSRSLYIVNNEN